MVEFLAKLQEDRRVSYGVLAVAVTLALLVGLVAFNKFIVSESLVAASSGRLEASEVQSEAEEVADIPHVDIGGDSPAPSAEEELLAGPDTPPERSDAKEAAGLGIATTTTPPTTAPPSTEPEPEPAPEPEVGQESFVDTGNGVFVPPVLLKIRFCESTDNYQAKNSNSTAAGGYQFLTSSWAAYGHAEKYGVSTADQATPAEQDQAALETWNVSGTTPWKASESCWN